MLQRLQAFFGGYGFPAFALALLVAFKILLLVILFVPASDTALGAFATDFRVWCFGYDPASGELDWSYVTTMFGELLLFGAIIFGVWREPLRAALRTGPRVLIPYVGTALLLVAGSTGVFAALQANASGPPVFPAAGLRTTIPAQTFSLINHEGAPVELEALRGRVVLVTGVYARCGLACPTIMAQAKRVAKALTEAELAQLTVVGITLDPAHDTPEVLREMARLQTIAAPTWNLVTGEPGVVERLLDGYGFERRRNPETGVIDHSNLFLLIDRGGRIAYRFTIGELQEQWLTEATRLLLREPPAASGA